MAKINMITKIKKYKWILIFISIFFLFLLIIFTYNVIYETNHFLLFSIDFRNKHEIISAYGTLIGGILAFLSILFVIYGLLQQSEQLLIEKIEYQENQKDNLFDHLKITSLLLESIISDVEAQNDRMISFYESLMSSLSSIIIMKFSVNKNYNRIIDMDLTTNYRSIKTFLKSDNWEKTFINLYNEVDFYSESLKDLFKNHQNHINNKIDEIKNLNYQFVDLASECSSFLLEYRIAYSESQLENDKLFNYINDYNLSYYKYLQENEISNYRYLSDNILRPLIEGILESTMKSGLPLNTNKIMKLSSYIRKEIFSIESYSKQYGENVEEYRKDYFSPDCDKLKSLKLIKIQLDNKIKAIDEKKN